MTTLTISGTELLASALVAFPAALPAVVLLLKITLVLLAALGLTQLMQRAPASSRHLVWLVTLGGLLLLPLLAIWAPLPLPVLPEESVVLSAEPVATATNSGSRETTGDQKATYQPGGPPLTISPAMPLRLDLGDSLLLLYVIVAAGLALRLLHGAWSVRRIERRAQRLEHPDWQTPLYQIADRLGLEHAPALLQSDMVKMPFAAGLLAPQIVLPAESEGWNAERRSAVLIHELGHVRRRDLIGHTLSRIVCALYWFHPLVWVAARRLRAESERACDDLALVFGARPSEYAEHLLDIVTCVRDHHTPAVALAMAHRKEFEGRMLAILNPELRRRAPARMATAALSGSVGVVALLIGAAAPVPRGVAANARMTADPGSELSLGDTAQRTTTRTPVAPPRSGLPQASPRAATAPTATPDPRPAADPAPSPSSVLLAVDSAPADERADVLARLLRTDSNAEVRRVAAWGLQRYTRADVAVQALSAAATGDADTAVREMAVWALAGAQRSSPAAGVLVTVLGKDRDPEVRATAAWAAGSIGNAVAVNALAGALADSNPEVREVAAWGIGNCDPRTAPAELLKALGDANRDVRYSVSWALYRIADPGAISAIDAAFRRETDTEVQRGLIRALGTMGDVSVEALQRLVASSDPEVRTVAVTALAGGNAGGPWPWPRPRPRPFP